MTSRSEESLNFVRMSIKIQGVPVAFGHFFIESEVQKVLLFVRN